MSTGHSSTYRTSASAPEGMFFNRSESNVGFWNQALRLIWCATSKIILHQARQGCKIQKKATLCQLMPFKGTDSFHHYFLSIPPLHTVGTCKLHFVTLVFRKLLKLVNKQHEFRKIFCFFSPTISLT